MVVVVAPERKHHAPSVYDGICSTHLGCLRCLGVSDVHIGRGCVSVYIPLYKYGMSAVHTLEHIRADGRP